MKTTFYLTVNRRGSVKTTKNRPGTDWDEVAVQMNLTLPDALFQKPQIQAFIEVKDAQIAPVEISAETRDNIREAIESVSGMEVRLEIVNPNQE